MMDSGNWGKQYSMENIIGCEYNMDNGYVEVYYSDGNILRLKCEDPLLRRTRIRSCTNRRRHVS